EKNGGDTPLRQKLRVRGQFFHIGCAPGFVIDAGGDMRIEIAIGAFRLAERPMDIDGEALHAKKVLISFCTAMPRWIRVFFCTSSISAKLSAWPSGTKTGS